MLQITTKTGFECEINEAALDDIELLDLVAQIETREARAVYGAYIGIINKIIPGEKARLYDHVRTEDGRVPLTAVEAEIENIFLSIKSAKK